MAGRALVVVLAVGALGVAVACAQAVTPKTQTCRVPALHLTFALPSDWACVRGGANGLRYRGEAPSRVGLVELYTAETPPGMTLSSYGPRLVEVVRSDFAKAANHPTVTSSTTRVASLPALLVSVHYQGLWLQGAGERGEIVHLIYFFLRKRLLYEFDYSSITPWATKYVPAFAASAKSVRFQ